MTLYILATIAALAAAGWFINRDAYERGYEHGRNEQQARQRHPAGSSNVKVVSK